MTTPRRRRKVAEVALNKAVKRGSTFIRDDLPVDGRLAIPRRYSELLNAILDDLGDRPTAAQLAIAKRASTLAVWAELREAALVRGEDFNVDQFSRAANTLRRLLADLGIERKTQGVTLSPSQYCEAKGLGL